MSEYTEHTTTGLSAGVVEKKFFTFAEKPGGMVLESGATLSPVTIAYETYGELDADGTNAVLICHALSGDSHVAGIYGRGDAKPGWWDFMVGPGKGIDTDNYFVICSNIIGSCQGSSGPCVSRPETNAPYGLDFPMVTIGDMVDAQKALLDHLGVER
ncbi:MAG: alpha/beta fold hydrolase, partial [Desulfosalsimonadaceae bacterium]|nr:alpha/beta fold hydrolase [Desulfosalsimonadaceae bacterium]